MDVLYLRNDFINKNDFQLLKMIFNQENDFYIKKTFFKQRNDFKLTLHARFSILIKIQKEYYKNIGFFSSVFVKKILKEHSKNMKIFWNIKRMFEKYTNIHIFFECSFNFFLKTSKKKI